MKITVRSKSELHYTKSEFGEGSEKLADEYKVGLRVQTGIETRGVVINIDVSKQEFDKLQNDQILFER